MFVSWFHPMEIPGFQLPVEFFRIFQINLLILCVHQVRGAASCKCWGCSGRSYTPWCKFPVFNLITLILIARLTNSVPHFGRWLIQTKLLLEVIPMVHSWLQTSWHMPLIFSVVELLDLEPITEHLHLLDFRWCFTWDRYMDVKCLLLSFFSILFCSLFYIFIL